MPQVTADPVERPDDQSVALAQTLQAGVEQGPVVAFAGSMIMDEARSIATVVLPGPPLLPAMVGTGMNTPLRHYMMASS